jgi:hypothetical protein
MKFELTKSDMEKVRAWSETVDEKRRKKQLDSKDAFIRTNANAGHAYYGAIGGELTYCFTPNSIGMSIEVIHADGEKLDLTDFDSW